MIFKREENEIHASWLELFHDLVFAVVIYQLGQNLSHNLSVNGFVSYVILFVPIWWAWIGATFYATRSNVDNLFHRILILMQIAGAVSLTVNLQRAFDKTSIGFILSYIAIRTNLIIEHIRTGHKMSEAWRPYCHSKVGYAFYPLFPWRVCEKVKSRMYGQAHCFFGFYL